MRPKSLAILCLLACLPAAGPAAADEASERALQAQIETATRQVMELELAVEREKRFYPPAEMWEEDIASLMKRARAAGIADRPPTPASLAPILLEGGRPSPLEMRRVTFSGEAEYEAVHRFLALLVRAPRRTDLERLRLTATPKRTVAYNIQLGLPVYTGNQAPPPRPAPPTATAGARTPAEAYERAREAVSRSRLAELSSRAAALQAVQRVFALHEERAARARAFSALARLQQATDTLAIGLTEFRLEEGITIEGVAVGAAARGGLGPALEEAGLSVRDVPFSRQGLCHRFSITAPVPVREFEDLLVPGNAPFDAATAAACVAPEGRMRGRIVARGSDPNGITVRLRGVDVPDLFRVLGRVTPLGFVVDGDVDGRVDVDYERASIDDAFGAMATAGIAGQAGALIRVSNVAAGGQGRAVAAHFHRPSRQPRSQGQRPAGPLRDVRDDQRVALRGARGRRGPDERRCRGSGVGPRIGRGGRSSRATLPARRHARGPGGEGPPPSRSGRAHLRAISARAQECRRGGPAAGGRRARRRCVAGLRIRPRARVVDAHVPGARFFDGEVKSVTATAVTIDVAGKAMEVKLP